MVIVPWNFILLTCFRILLYLLYLAVSADDLKIWWYWCFNCGKLQMWQSFHEFFFFFFSWRVSCFLISLMYLFWCTCDKLFIMTKVSFFPVCVSDFLELNIHLCDLSFPHECHFLFKSCKFLVYGINVVTTMYLGPYHDFYQRSHVHTFLSVIFITFKICVQV